MNNDLIGSIRKNELRDILAALLLARPDYSEAIATVAIATGLVENVPIETNQYERLHEVKK